MIAFEQVNTTEKFSDWRKFAAEFDHDTATPTMPIYMLNHNNSPMGFFHVLNQPIVFPAFHPGKTSPRGLREAIEAMSNVFSFQSMGSLYPRGVTFTALPIKDQRVIPNSAKLGFESLGVELYQKIP